MNDSAVHAAFTGLDPLDDGTAAKAARDLIRESGRQPVLDQALLEALDAAAKAAEARRAVTLAVLPATATTPSVIAPRPAPPVMTAAPVPVTDRSDEPALDISAEFARHDDLVETARHAAMDDGSTSAPTPPPPATGTGRHLALDVDEDAARRTHRTVVTRPSGRRWIPAGVGIGVVAIVGAVVLTSGFGSDGGPVSTDEAARTGTSTTEPAPLPTSPPPGANTIDLTVPVVVVEEEPSQVPSPTAYTPTVVQPQVATPPTAGSTSPAPTTPGPSSQPGTPPSAVMEDPAATLDGNTPVLDPELTDPTASTASVQADSSVPTT
ncbi:hypothetical protein GCM10023162_11040 [Klenkia terrae]